MKMLSTLSLWNQMSLISVKHLPVQRICWWLVPIAFKEIYQKERNRGKWLMTYVHVLTLVLLSTAYIMMLIRLMIWQILNIINKNYKAFIEIILTAYSLNLPPRKKSGEFWAQLRVGVPYTVRSFYIYDNDVALTLT